MIELMQALFSTIPETAQQPMTDFRRLCLEAEEKSEPNAATADMDNGQQPENPYSGEIKRLEDEYGPFANGMSITVELNKLLMMCPRKRRRKDAYRGLQNALNNIGVQLNIKSRKK